MSKLPVHHCDDPECPSFCNPSSKSCKCHMDSTQMLLDQRNRLFDAALDVETTWLSLGLDARHPAFVSLARALSRVEANR